MTFEKFEVVTDRSRFETDIVVMWTTDKVCIPDPEILKEMAHGGYRFRINGKPVTPKEVEEWI